MYFFKKKSEIHSLDEIKNIALKVLDNDENRNKVLERKAEILLGFLGVIIPLVIGLFYYFIPKVSVNLNSFSLFIFLSLLFFIISTTLCICTIITRTFKNINLSKIWEDENYGYNISSLINIKRKLIHHFYKIHKLNKKVLDSKANIISVAFFSFISGLVFIIVVFLILLFL